MERFVEISMSFPVVIFSFLLCISVLYWLVAMFGLLDLDGHHIEADGALEGTAGLLMKVGLEGVPLTIVISLISLTGWLTAYLVDLLVLRHLGDGALSILFGLVTAVVAFIVAVASTNVVVRLLRPLFRKVMAPTANSIIGRVATVRSGSVTELRGDAIYEDGGAGMIIDVRSMNGATFSRGDRVVLLEYQASGHCYLVISEDEFNS